MAHTPSNKCCTQISFDEKVDITTLKKVTKTIPNMNLLNISANNVTDFLVDNNFIMGGN